MNTALQLKRFISSHYLFSGLRITFSAIVPAVILYQYGTLQSMVSVPLGALIISGTDVAGPIHHRINSMLAGIIINFIVLVITGYVHFYPSLIIVELVVFTMFFTMLGVYGNRISTIGLNALLVFVLNVDSKISFGHIWMNALYFTAGSVSYFLLSLLLHRLRPYRNLQQQLGELIMNIADYMQTQSKLYEKGSDYEKLSDKLLQDQIFIQQKQEELRETLFKTRQVVVDTTVKGRVLMMMFLDSVDLFERMLTLQQDEEGLHKDFDNDHILEQVSDGISTFANSMHEAGWLIQSNLSSSANNDLTSITVELNKAIDKLRLQKLNTDNLSSFIRLRQTLYILDDITERINRLHRLTSFDRKAVKQKSPDLKGEAEVPHTEISPGLFFSNLTFKSEHFRHAMRLTLALLAGYIVSLLFPLGHGYWIMLTTLVILKPAYSISRKRNIHRLLGTLTGGLIGFVLLYYINNTTGLFTAMMITMVIAYSFLKVNYYISSICITLYVLLSLHLLSNTDFKVLITDRIEDTFIGCVIAFVASLTVLPLWEYEHMNKLIGDILQSNSEYFKAVSQTFLSGKTDVQLYKPARKNAFVALSNLSDNFQRMISEPLTKTELKKSYHQFVSSSYIMLSQIASLSSYAQRVGSQYVSTDFQSLINMVGNKLDKAKRVYEETEISESNPDNDQYPIRQQLNMLFEERRNEIKKGIDEPSKSVRRKLSDLKSIHDRFDMIGTIAEDEIKILKKIKKQMA